MASLEQIKSLKENEPPPPKSYWLTLLPLLQEIDPVIGPTKRQLDQLEIIDLSHLNQLPRWKIKVKKETIDLGYELLLWSVSYRSPETEQINSINNAPLQMIVCWLLQRGLVMDLNRHINLLDKNTVDDFFF